MIVTYVPNCRGKVSGLPDTIYYGLSSAKRETTARGYASSAKRDASLYRRARSASTVDAVEREVRVKHGWPSAIATRLKFMFWDRA